MASAKWLFLLLACLCGKPCLGSDDAEGSCQDVRGAVRARGILGVARDDFRDVPAVDSSLTLCPSASPGCCTSTLETALARWSDEQFAKAVAVATDSRISEPWRQRAQKIDEYVLDLLGSAYAQFHSTFSRTYGHLYEQNAGLFKQFFDDIRSFYQWGQLDLPATTTSFFRQLFQRMFRVMNAQYELDEEFLSCVGDTMEELRPFGEYPAQVSGKLQKSLSGVRALAEAVRSGAEFAKEIKTTSPSSECLLSVERMNSCATCSGRPGLRPCPGLCANVMKGCLAQHQRMQEGAWDGLVDSLLTLLDRLGGALNPSNSVNSLGLNLSAAIMELQGDGYQVTQDVFQKCGTPRVISKRAAEARITSNTDSSAGGAVVQPRLTPETRIGGSGRRRSKLDRMLADVRRTVRSSYGYWRKLPYEMCYHSADSNDNNNSDSLSAQCWNGTAEGVYSAAVVEDGFESQAYNPEVSVDLSASDPLESVSRRVRDVSSQCRLAASGEAVTWWDQKTQQQDDTNSSSGGRVRYSASLTNSAAYLDDNSYSSSNSHARSDGGRSFNYHSRSQHLEGSGDDDDFDDDFNDERSYYGSGDEDDGYDGWEGSGGDDDDFEGSGDGDDEFDPWGDEQTTVTATEAADIDLVDEGDDESTSRAPDALPPTAGAAKPGFGAYRAAVVLLLPQLACWLPQLFVL